METLNLNASKIIYLDQKGWIDLAKIYYGNPTIFEKKLLQKILKSSDNGTAVFPISLVNMEETASIQKPRWRRELSSLMIKISKYHVLSPYWDRILQLEIQNLILEKIGLPRIDIRKTFVKKGFSWLMGGKPTVTSEEMDSKFLEKLNQELLKTLDEPSTFEFLFSHRRDYDSQTREEDLKAVETFERIRQNLRSVKDNEIRRKASLIQNTYATVFPKFTRISYDMGLTPENVKKYFFTRFNIDEFLEKLPTALCEFTLLFQRDQQLERPIKLNDIKDIWHLTLSIPHSDIVVTEKMWTSIAKRAKLDKKCNTIILSSLKDLDKFL